MVNMIQIRNSVFETNSSSSHSFTVSRLIDKVDDLRKSIEVMMNDKDAYYAEKLLDSLSDLIKEYDDSEEEYDEW